MKTKFSASRASTGHIAIACLLPELCWASGPVDMTWPVVVLSILAIWNAGLVALNVDGTPAECFGKGLITMPATLIGFVVLRAGIAALFSDPRSEIWPDLVAAVIVIAVPIVVIYLNHRNNPVSQFSDNFEDSPQSDDSRLFPARNSLDDKL